MKTTLTCFLIITLTATLCAQNRVNVIEYANFKRYQSANDTLPELGKGEKRVEDPHYTMRAWRAVLTYLLRQHEFLYE